MTTLFSILPFLFSLSAFAADDCKKIELKPGSNPRAYQSLKVPSGCAPEKVFSCPDGVLSAYTLTNNNTDRVIGAECLRHDDPKVTKARIPAAPKRNHPATTTSSEAATPEQEEELKRYAKGEGIPDLIFERALANFKDLKAQGKTQRACFVAADLTTSPTGNLWLLCLKPFPNAKKMPTQIGTGAGEDCKDHLYRNSRYDGCARFFGNKESHCLSAGGRYVTGPASTTALTQRPLTALLGLDKGDNDNSDARNIGIHTTATRSNKRSYVGKTDPNSYSNGCLTIPFDDQDPYALQAEHFSSALNGGGVAVYIYPAKSDILEFQKNGKAAYWDETCAAKIKKPGWLGQNEFAVPSNDEMRLEGFMGELRLKPSQEDRAPSNDEGRR